MISVCGYNGTAMAGGTDGTLISEGTTETGGNGTNPLVVSTNLGGESRVIPFAIRLSGAELSYIPIALKSNDTVDYTVTFNSYSSGSSMGFNAFDGILNNSGWKADGNKGWIRLQKKTGDLTISGYEIAGSNDRATMSPVSWNVKKNNGEIIDSITSQSWIKSESKRFFLEKTCTINDLTFEFVSGESSYLNIQEIKFFVCEALPDINKITVSAEGTNTDKWSFSADGNTFTAYGVPLVINVALADKNIQLYVKCKSVAADKLGSDTSAKIKIVAE